MNCMRVYHITVVECHACCYGVLLAHIHVIPSNTNLQPAVHYQLHIADRKATTWLYTNFFYSVVLTTQNYHWYAATRFAFP